MATNSDINFGFIVNNQGGNDLLVNNYILKYVRPNQDKSHYYKCRHSIVIENHKVNCPASATIRDGIMLRYSSDHNHPAVSQVCLEVLKSKRKEKELAATSREPLSQIHSEVQSELVNTLTKDIDKTNIAEVDAVLDEVAREFPDYLNVKSGLGKIRSKNLPTLPKSIDEVNLTGNIILNLIVP